MDERKSPAATGNDGPFCPELPAVPVPNKLNPQVLGGFILQPCIGERCAKFFGCQEVPRLAAAFYKQNIITGSAKA